MSYNPYTSTTPPRPFRVIVGGCMVIGGLFFGMVAATYEFHKALLVQNEPVEMEWQTLVTEGCGDNAYICLVDVDVIEPEVDAFWDEEAIDMLEDNPIIGQDLVDEIIGPAKVVPRGRTANASEQVVIPSRSHLIDEAYRQLDETGAITGIVSRYTHEEMVGHFLNMEPIADFQGEDVYKMVPIDPEVDLEVARNLFLSAGFLLSLGLVLCGSGGPGIWTCWYAPLPSAISLVGYPMRYGRGGMTMRITYAVVGIALMGNGYQLMVLQGGFGQSDGHPLFHALGFASMFIGLGAVLAVPLQITCRSLAASVEVAPKKKPVRMSWQQACSMEAVEREIEYEDDVLAPMGTIPLTGELKEKADQLEAAGFTKGQSLQWQRAAGVAAATIQVGCQQMVVTDMEYDNETDIIETGLISVLGTGLPIITVSANSGFAKNKATTNSLFQKADTSEPTEMLASHLEVVVGEAEKRDTYVVEIHESEVDDVVQLARRAIAEIQAVVDGNVITVGAKRYGRFHFPPAPVPELYPAATSEA